MPKQERESRTEKMNLLLFKLKFNKLKLVKRRVSWCRNSPMLNVKCNMKLKKRRTYKD